MVLRIGVVAVVVLALVVGSVVVAQRFADLNVRETVSDIGDADQGLASPTVRATEPLGTVGSPIASPTGGVLGVGTPTGEAGSASPTRVPVEEIEHPRETAEAYVAVWSAGNYDAMYDLLSTNAQSAISRQDFVTRYQNIAIEAGIVKLDAKVTGGDDDDEIFPIRVDIESSRIGAFRDENQVPIVKEGDQYRVDWTPSLIFSGLGSGYVHWTPDIPTRGRILDRKGRPLAQMGMVTRVGVVPGKIANEQELLARLPGLLGMTADQVKAKYASGQPDWFMPIKDLPDQVEQGLLDQLQAIQGVSIQKWPARVYPQGPLTAHVVGYISQVTAEELPELAARGYVAGDMVGRAGIERFAESWLAGKRGGTLALLAQDDSVIRVLGQVASEPAHDVILTIDLDTQIAADLAVGDQVGSAVVMDPNNGEVLAMVSKPTYDPNWFILGISDEQWAQLNDPQRQPLVNRVTQAGYPTGSVFKLVTAAAGMTHLGYTEDSVIPCPGEFSLPGSPAVWRDWVPGGQGDLTLHNAIVRSCNTVFYRMGAELDEKDEHLLPDMVRAFGFGTPTGIPELDEIPGVVPDPEWKMENVGDFWARGDAVNLAIGQGYFVASPLQLADAYVAVANGGTLWVPHLVLDIVRLDGSVAFHAEPKEKGKLPLPPDMLDMFRRAMYDVVNASNGTATVAFEGEEHPVSGKTGTAETGKPGEDAHAWFASFTPSDSPRIVVVTMIEHGKAGSVAAAPVARKIIDAYYVANP